MNRKFKCLSVQSSDLFLLFVWSGDKCQRWQKIFDANHSTTSSTGDDSEKVSGGGGIRDVTAASTAVEVVPDNVTAASTQPALREVSYHSIPMNREAMMATSSLSSSSSQCCWLEDLLFQTEQFAASHENATHMNKLDELIMNTQVVHYSLRDVEEEVAGLIRTHHYAEIG